MPRPYSTVSSEPSASANDVSRETSFGRQVFVSRET
jgi:hypothetical protein